MYKVKGVPVAVVDEPVEQSRPQFLNLSERSIIMPKALARVVSIDEIAIVFNHGIRHNVGIPPYPGVLDRERRLDYKRVSCDLLNEDVPGFEDDANIGPSKLQKAGLRRIK